MPHSLFGRCRLDGKPAGFWKSALVLGHVDILQQMAKLDLIPVMLSITTLTEDLARAMDPRTSSPARRVYAIRKLVEGRHPGRRERRTDNSKAGGWRDLIRGSDGEASQ